MASSTLLLPVARPGARQATMLIPLFELHFDHSFKEKGQANIRTEVVLPLAK